MDLRTMSYEELADYDAHPKSIEEVSKIIIDLTERKHDYNSCVYAMAIAASAAMKYVATKLAVTGYQFSAAEMKLIAKSRNLDMGGRLLNYQDILYPQYCDNEHFPSWEDVLKNNKEKFVKKAKEFLVEHPSAAPNVIAHWQKIASMEAAQ